MSITIGKMLDRSGYLQDLREDRTEDGEARIENLAELVSAAREYESREPEPSLGGFVDRLSLLSDVDEEQGTRDARIWLMTLHSAKGLEFPTVILAGLEEGLFPHSRSSGRRGRARGRAAALLRRHDARAAAAGAHRRGAAPGVRRVPVQRAVALHRRGAVRAGRTDRADVLVVRLSGQLPALRVRTNPYGRGGRRQRPRARRDSRPTRTRTKTSRPGWRSGRACACVTRSSASGRHRRRGGATTVWAKTMREARRASSTQVGVTRRVRR